MQAMQIVATEGISAAVPLRVNVEPCSPTAPEDFGTTWQREMNAPGLNAEGMSAAAQRQASIDTQSNDRGLEEMPPAQEVAAKANRTSPEEVTRNADESLPLNDEPKAAAKNARERTKPEAKADGGHQVPQKGSSGIKRGVKASGAVDLTERVKSQAEILPVASLAETGGIGGGVPTLANRPGVTQASVECSPATKRERIAGQVAQNPFSKPLQSAEEGDALTAGKGAATATLESGTKLEKGQAAIASCASSSRGHGNGEVVPASPPGLHLDPAEAIGRVAPTLTTNHPASPTAGTALQIDASTDRAGTGVKVYRALGAEPVQLDVGVFDGTHGWLRIRAELGAGGAVSASLTAASASAHESLRAALPEMASYLRSEAISVDRISVHRNADGLNVMTSAQGHSEQKGDAQGRNPKGDEVRDYGGLTNKNTADVDGDSPASTFAATNSVSSSSMGGGAVLNAWVACLPRVMSGFGIASWFAGGSSGSWLNVCA